MFRVGLDLRGSDAGFKSHFGRGTGRYVTELSRELLTRTTDRLAIVPLGTADLRPTGWQDTLLKVIPAGRITLETQFLLPSRIDRRRLDFMHFFAHGDSPARMTTPTIVSVLDLIPLRFPDLYRAATADWRFRLARSLELAAIRRATGIVAISEATKRDLVSILAVPEERILVTPLGVGSQFLEAAPRDGRVSASPAERVSMRRELGLPAERPMLLYVGGIDPRKNAPFLLEVFAALRARVRDLKPLLVFAGGIERDREFPKLRRKLVDEGVEDDVQFVGFVPDEQLPKYYRAADAMVFPSLYEGFGLPVAESLLAGTVVVCSGNSSLPEVTGPDYSFPREGDVSDWATFLERVLRDRTFADTLLERGARHARRFTWSQTADLTLAAYERFLSNPIGSQRGSRTANGGISGH